MILTHGASSISRGVGGEFVKIGDRFYPVVRIGDLIWMAENLDYKFDGLVVGGDISSTEPRANYYNNDEATYGVNGNKYGLLYNGHAVVALSEGNFLPQGWRVPTTSDRDNLIGSAGPSVELKSTSGWRDGYNGNNESGFNVVPAGGRYEDGFRNLGDYAVHRISAPYNFALSYYNSYLYGDSSGDYYQFSVRLCRDA